MILQEKYCKEHNLPDFAGDGRCFRCGRQIPDTDKFHITGCPSCNVSFCD